MDDYHLDEHEAEFAEARMRAICEDAAIYIVCYLWTEDAAMRKADEIFEAQQEAMSDVTRVKETLAEAQSPKMPEGEEVRAQVRKVAAELFEKYQ